MSYSIYFSRVIFKGRVQGVGFRYTVYELAKGYAVCGIVKNLENGDVLLEVEGTREETEKFVQAIEEERKGYITEIKKEGNYKEEKKFKNFSIT